MTEPHRDEIAKLEALHAQHPDGRVFTHLAEAYRKAGELARALETVESGLVRHPEYASAHVVRGRILLDLGQTDGAAAAFRDVLELDRHNLIALRALGELARDGGRSDEALGYFRELLTVDPGDHELNAEIERMETGSAKAADAGAPNAAAVSAEDTEAEPGEPEQVADALGTSAPEGLETPGAAALDAPAAAGEPIPLTADSFGALADSGAGAAGGWPSPGPSEPAAEPDEAAAEAGRPEPDEDDVWSGAWWSSDAPGEESAPPEETAETVPADVSAAAEPPPSGDAVEDEAGTDFHWTFPGFLEEETPAVEVRTETMASLYAAQGLWHRAAEIYRSLLEERPGDAQLEARLAEAESQVSDLGQPAGGPQVSETAALEGTAAGGDQWLEGVESAWTGSQGAAGASASPYDWPEDAGEEAEPGPSAGEYLRALAAWQPGGPARGLGEEGEEGEELDEGENALREWLAEEQATAVAGEPAAMSPESAGETAPEGEEDEDVEMFRSWLQSLRK